MSLIIKLMNIELSMKKNKEKRINKRLNLIKRQNQKILKILLIR